ncbi:MAG: uracil-DNA glycosylase family protein [Halobacteriales archaeon]
MRNVTRETSNPFGMRPPCPCRCTGDTDRRAVFGYGDANADFHVIGDHPGVHGGAETGVPFIGTPPGERLLAALDRAEMIGYEGGSDLDPERCYLSYRYPCCVPDGETPTAEEYAQFDRFLDAELRAISAHVLFPVGERTTRYVIEEHTTVALEATRDMNDLHATEIRGRGFLVVPVADPSRWDGHADDLIGAIDQLRSGDYEQMVDLGRFIPDAEPYFVR